MILGKDRLLYRLFQCSPRAVHRVAPADPDAMKNCEAALRRYTVLRVTAPSRCGATGQVGNNWSLRNMTTAATWAFGSVDTAPS